MVCDATWNGSLSSPSPSVADTELSTVLLTEEGRSERSCSFSLQGCGEGGREGRGKVKATLQNPMESHIALSSVMRHSQLNQESHTNKHKCQSSM